MKLYVIAGLAIALMLFAYWAHGKVYDSGYSDAVTEQQKLAIEQQNEAIAQARVEWELTAAAGEREIIIEERIVEKIRVVEREIPVIVEKIVELTPECADLGPDFLGLFNAAISASNSGEDPGSGFAAEPDTTL
jgi:hypothetical protein